MKQVPEMTYFTNLAQRVSHEMLLSALQGSLPYRRAVFLRGIKLIDGGVRLYERVIRHFNKKITFSDHA